MSAMGLQTVQALLMTLLIAGYFLNVTAVGPESNILAGLQSGIVRTHKKTSGHVCHLEEDSFVTGNLLYSDSHTLMTTDGRKSDLIVGSGMGYAEGRSAQAQFRFITGFLQISATHVLVVDLENHCLRYINRVANETSTFAGNCGEYGFSDGQHKNARFYQPFTLIKDLSNPASAIVTDAYNLALRSIEILTGKVKTLIKQLPAPPVYGSFDTDKETIFLSFFHFLGKFNVKTLKFVQLTQIANSVGLHREFNTAFVNPREILCSNGVCLVADIGSNMLRVINIRNQTAYAIGSGIDASVDGLTTNCSMKAPHSFLLKSQSLYVGEYGAIRHITVPCLSTPCLNSGRCTIGKDDKYLCICKAGWTGKNCENDSRVKMRLDFFARYMVPCNSLGDFQQLTLSTATKRYSQIELITSGLCNRSVETDIAFSCTAEVLQVTWPTDCIFDSNSSKDKERTLNILHENLKKANGLTLELLIPNHMPAIVKPTLNKEGFVAEVIITSICPVGMKYVSSTESCQ